MRPGNIAFYRAGQCRNDPKARTHTYAETTDGGLWPMCDFGWNRSNGDSFSIFRDVPGSEGACKLCARNVSLGKQPVLHPHPHKTRWL